MDKISGKIIKYAGNWNSNIFTLVKNIAISDKTITVLKGTNVLQAIEGDLITMLVGTTKFVCKYNNTNILTIVSPVTRADVILANSSVAVLEHLLSLAPEDLVTRFELNRINTTINIATLTILTDIINANSASYDLSKLELEIGNVNFEVIEKIGNKYESSTVDWTINNKILQWSSMTAIPNAIGIISIMPSKKLS